MCEVFEQIWFWWDTQIALGVADFVKLNFLPVIMHGVLGLYQFNTLCRVALAQAVCCGF